ncbi:VPLPA-CTERM sorting domain-containing protein [Rhodosalinus sp. K401]|uniref:VPLPA-CTERM sorting domain-containing protein n=1 Tax=Rhodosalinus sp. K401 TaxID=3239195 RepID=UPI003525BD53
MFKTTFLASAIAVAAMASPALASTLTGTFQINIYNFSDNDPGGSSSTVTQTNSAATPTNVAAQTLDATVTYTGTIDFRIGGGNSNSTYISDFLESSSSGSYTIDSGTQTFLDNTLLSQGTYVTTTFFEFIGSFSGAATGTITHDDGVYLTAVNSTGGISSPPTTEENTDFTADAGDFTLIYAAANGNPSILEIDATVVPLPASALLLLAGLGGLAAVGRRRTA